MKKTDLSYIELSKKNLIHNLKTLKDLTKKAKIVAVVKGNAYGHGQNEVAKILEPFVDYFQVNSIFELKLLRKISRKKTFVLGYVEKNDLSRAIKLGCILSVFSLEQMSTISAIAKSVNMVQEIHLPIDAYLGREGFLEKELPKIVDEIGDIVPTIIPKEVESYVIRLKKIWVEKPIIIEVQCGINKVYIFKALVILL